MKLKHTVLVLAAMYSTVATAGVDYSLTLDESTGVYTVDVVSDVDMSGKNSMVGSAQVSMVLPVGAVPVRLDGGGEYKVTDSNEVGSWQGQDLSKDISSPDILETDPRHVLQVMIAPTGAKLHLQAGVAKSLFSFMLKGECTGGDVRMLSKDENFFKQKPNSKGLASASTYSTINGEQKIDISPNQSAPCAVTI